VSALLALLCLVGFALLHLLCFALLCVACKLCRSAWLCFASFTLLGFALPSFDFCALVYLALPCFALLCLALLCLLCVACLAFILLCSAVLVLASFSLTCFALLCIELQAQETSPGGPGHRLDLDSRPGQSLIQKHANGRRMPSSHEKIRNRPQSDVKSCWAQTRKQPRRDVKSFLRTGLREQ